MGTCQLRQGSQPRQRTLPPHQWREGEKEDTEMLAGGFEGDKRVVGALCHAQKILEGVLRDAPAQRAKSAA